MSRSMWIWGRRVLVAIPILIVAALALFFALRFHQASGLSHLSLWHTWVPDEADAREIDRMSWPQWLARESKLIASVQARMKAGLGPEDRVEANRYFDGSPLSPAHLSHDWNLTFTLAPEGDAAGAVVLLHGLTDSPYSLRHLARLCQQHGYFVVAVRMPGHGTVPAALTDVRWQDWDAATRLAVREAVRLAGPGKPLHLVAYSNGAALALKYALDSLDSPGLRRPDRLVLISPMIGINSLARYAGIAGWPALLPSFAELAWMEIEPEFNPFKYNSFPVNAARQSYLLTDIIGKGLRKRAASGGLADLPPILAFQSVLDATVDAHAVIAGLFDHLPANGSEIVLFDVNRSAALGGLLSEASRRAIVNLMPSGEKAYRVTVIGNMQGGEEVLETSVAAGETRASARGLGVSYPAGLFSLSHVALPFPITDALYGSIPEEPGFGIRLGTLALKGEVGTLLAGGGMLWRTLSNPFYPYLEERIARFLEPGVDAQDPRLAR